MLLHPEFGFSLKGAQAAAPGFQLLVAPLHMLIR
jgi:hypothetical protein